MRKVLSKRYVYHTEQGKNTSENFLKIVDNKAYLFGGNTGGWLGFNEKEKEKAVKDTLGVCGLKNAEFPDHWPSSEQIDSMNLSMSWGRLGKSNQYSLMLFFSAQQRYKNETECFIKEIDAWQRNYNDLNNKDLVATLIVVGSVLFFSFIGKWAAQCCCGKQNKRRVHSHHDNSSLALKERKKEVEANSLLNLNDNIYSL